MLLSATGRDKKISIHNINIKEDYLTIWLWFNRDLNSNLIIYSLEFLILYLRVYTQSYLQTFQTRDNYIQTKVNGINTASSLINYIYAEREAIYKSLIKL